MLCHIREGVKIKILKNFFKLSFCLFCCVSLSGCFDNAIDDDVINNNSSDMSSQGDTSEESFLIPSSKLDILVVLPQGSDGEKTKLGLGLSRLLISDTYFQSLDWQVAFISEDPNQNNSDTLPTFLPLRNPNGNIQEPETNDNIYVVTSELQTDHSITELIRETMMSSTGNMAQPLISMIQSIGKTENQSFFREDALLATIILNKDQDEDEDTPPTGVIASAQNHLGDSKEFTVYGIITEVGDTECAQAQTQDVANFSYAVSDLIDEVEGIAGSICEEEYNTFITEIESDIKERLINNSNEIQLKYTNIIKDKISLTFDPEKNDQEWNFDSQENKIIFDNPVLEGTTVEVSYEYLDMTTTTTTTTVTTE